MSSQLVLERRYLIVDVCGMPFAERAITVTHIHQTYGEDKDR
jgi:hypothetical protein